MNIQLSYTYRDGANYKQNDAAVFANISGMDIAAVDEAIRGGLIDGCWFYADKWGLKDLHAYEWDEEIDHEWHEYGGLTLTEEVATNGDIASLLEVISNNMR